MESEEILVEKTVETTEMIRQRINSELTELGVLEVPEEVVDRRLLMEESGFNNDSRMIREGLENILEALERKHQLRVKLTPEYKREMAISALLHDIGKTGWGSADKFVQRIVIKLFSSDKITDPYAQTVSEILKTFQTEDYDKAISGLLEMGVMEDMTMRDFFDRHALWTLEILNKYPGFVSERVKLVTSSHHMVERGQNPYGVSEDEVPEESIAIGALENYVNVLEKNILEVMDKYQANRLRSGSTHEVAMAYTRNVFKKRNDPMTKIILEVIDELGSQDALFPNATKIHQGTGKKRRNNYTYVEKIQ